MKVSIQTGASSISIEGDLAEVLEVLANYWNPATNETGSEDGEEGGPLVDPERQTKRKTRKNRNAKKPSGATKGGANGETRLDANALSNSIKAHPKFQEIKEKILDVKADWKTKCLLVAWIADVPISSGDVHRVLQELRIRVGLPQLSTALSINSTEFLTEPGPNNSTNYLLTASAKKAFEEFLSKPK